MTRLEMSFWPSTGVSWTPPETSSDRVARVRIGLPDDLAGGRVDLPDGDAALARVRGAVLAVTCSEVEM